jgi:precorrin-6A/cobalt-precorrin-6A reductase
LILVLGGTADARVLVSELSQRGYPALVCTATPYGGRLVAGTGGVEVVDRPLGPEDLSQLMRDKQIDLVVDATHPYATAITSTAAAICREMSIEYLRYHRPGAAVPQHPLIHWCADFPEAAARAAGPGQTIFLTTGSKTLGVFVKAAREHSCRLVARVLPDSAVLASCRALGLEPADIVAVQGPFSHHLNLALFKEFKATVVVTKDSGQVGGTDTKISAALELNTPVVVVARPPDPGCLPGDLDSLIALIEFKTVGR